MKFKRSMSRRMLSLSALSLTALVSIGLTMHRTQLEAQSAAPTYAKEVAPILYKNCTTCHRDGGIGPFSLLDYDVAKKNVKDIRDAVSTGYMPPWHADAPHGTFLNDRRLSADEKQTLLRWIDAGAQKGNLKELPKAPEYASSWTVGTPDAVVSMSNEYTVPAEGTIDYQYFQVPTNFTEDKWVQALEILPGAREVVHHVLVYARAPQGAPPTPGVPPVPGAAPNRPVLIQNAALAPQELPARANSEIPPPRGMGALIGTTAPGTNVLQFAEGTALKVSAGTILTFQMHYTTQGHVMKDRTSVGFVFAKSPPTEQILAGQFINGAFMIPAGAKDFEVPSDVGFREAVKVYGIFPHTHLRGVRWEYKLQQPDGSSAMILNVPRYDFKWQTYYMFATPLEIPAGAKIVSRAWYDNSTSNKDNPDPTKSVKWGDQTWEEMQYTGILYSINSRRLKPAP